MNWTAYFKILQNAGTRYFVSASLVFIIFYIFFKTKPLLRKIQPNFPKNQDYLREMGYSALSIAIFALVPTILIFNPAVRAHTLLMSSPYQYGHFYFWFAFIPMFFIHDAYFYWAHRLMHHPNLFKYVHAVHHQSVNPSPWAAYAFHPLEALVEIGIYIVFLFCIPLYIIHLGFFFLFQIVYNVYGHSGFEFFPRGFNKNWFGRWVNTSVSHNMHHRYFKGNYGLYTSIWDRWMGTIHAKYDETYEAVKGVVSEETAGAILPENFNIEGNVFKEDNYSVS